MSKVAFVPNVWSAVKATGGSAEAAVRAMRLKV